MTASLPDVLVVGGGVIGLSAAWRLAETGARVSVLEPAPGSGASHAAAGMLAPVTEAHYGEEELIGLNVRSRLMWPVFAAQVEEASGLEVSYDDSGTLAIAFDQSDKAALDELYRFQQKLGLESSPISPKDCRQVERALAPGVRGGLQVPGDHQVDPRKLTAALCQAALSSGVNLVSARAAELRAVKGVAEAVVTERGDVLEAGAFLLAAGWGSALLSGLGRFAPPVRPVKGQVIRLALREDLPRPTHTVRALVKGQTIYVVPRQSGELVVGATVEEMGVDERVTAGAVYSLLRDAQAVVPVLAEAELVETVAGLRPGSPDNAPLVGPSGIARLYLATGHYRNGILLAPVTAEAVAAGLSGGSEEPFLGSAFDPRRFLSK